MIRLLVLMVLVSTPAMAAVYKWTDEKGRVHYSDSPHSQATKVEVPAQGAGVDSNGAMTIEQQLSKFRTMEQEERRERRQDNAGRGLVQMEERSVERRAERCLQEKKRLARHREELRNGCLIKKCEWHAQKIRYYELQIKLDCS